MKRTEGLPGGRRAHFAHLEYMKGYKKKSQKMWLDNKEWRKQGDKVKQSGVIKKWGKKKISKTCQKGKDATDQESVTDSNWPSF